MLREEEFEKRERLLERKMSTLEMTASGGVRPKYTDWDDLNEDDGEEDDEEDSDGEENNASGKSPRESNEMINFKDHSKDGQSRRVLYFLCEHSPMSLLSKVE